ncbi:MAG: SCO family protein [Cyclobacteriaceae bacterium]|nr:SCO family protein [Cyclobacteriaceae bacterium]
MNYFFILFLAMGLFLSACNGGKEKLPVLGRKEIKNVSFEGKMVADTVYHTIRDFSFTDQDGNQVTQDTFEDKIYVTDFFFTTCPTICPIMKSQMLRVYERFKDHPEVLFLSHSIDPRHDSVAVLHEFAQRLGVDSEKWHFVTGDQDEIYDIGQNSYMVTAREDPDEPGGYLHSGAFLLIDKQRRVRGIYDGTKEEKVNLLMEDIEKLLSEYHQE